MARELRQRSPVQTRHSGQHHQHGATTTTSTMYDSRKRKLDDAEQSIRRSTRSLLAAEDLHKSKAKVRATWKRPWFIVAGLPQRLLKRLELDNFQDGESAKLDATSEDPSEDDNDSDDGATWEKRWINSPSKRRKIERLSDSPASSPVASSRGHSRNNSNIKLNTGVSNLRRQLAKTVRGSWPFTDAELNAAAITPPPPAVSDKSSRDVTARSSQSRAKSDTHSDTPSNTHNGGSQLQDSQQVNDLASNRSSPSPSLSPVPSSPATPEAVEVEEEEAANDTHDFQQDPDYLESYDLPPAFGQIQPPGPPESYEDEAARILCTIFAPIPLPQRFIRPLTAHPPSTRSIETLWTLATNAQKALKLWQEEYIKLDSKTAPVTLPFAKKPCTGGRIPVDMGVFDLEKHKELYADGGVLAKAMGIVHPSASRSKGSSGTPALEVGLAGGRELRRRRGDNGVVEGLGISSDDAGAQTNKRARKPAKKFDVGQNNNINNHNAADPNNEKEASAEPVVKRRRRNIQKPPAAAEPEKIYLSGGPRNRRVQALARQEEQATMSPTSERGPTYGEAFAHRNEPPAVQMLTRAKTKSPANQQQPSPLPQAQYPQSLPLKAPEVDTHMRLPRAPTGAAAHRNRAPAKSQVAKNAAKKDQPPLEPVVPLSPASAAAAAEKKARAKSEKRSESMTAWWAARKKKAAEERIKEMHDRGEFREGTWNVDTVKAWGAAADRQNAANAAAAAAMPAGVGTYGNQRMPIGGYVGYMGQGGTGPGHWVPSWGGPPPINISSGPTALTYPYSGYAYNMPPGMHYDNRGYSQQHHGTLPPQQSHGQQSQQTRGPQSQPLHGSQSQQSLGLQSHASQQRGLDAPAHSTTAPLRLSSINQLLTPNHPFAQASAHSQNQLPQQSYHPHQQHINGPPSRRGSPFQASMSQKSCGESPGTQRRASFNSGPHTGNSYPTSHQDHRQATYNPYQAAFDRYGDHLQQPLGQASRQRQIGSMLPEAARNVQQGAPNNPQAQREAVESPAPSVQSASVVPKPVIKHRPFEL